MTTATSAPPNSTSGFTPRPGPRRGQSTTHKMDVKELMSLDDMQALGIVCGALLALLALTGWAVRGLRRMWRLLSKANRWLDQVLGEPASAGIPARPGLMERVTGIEEHMKDIDAKLAEHLEWHGEPGGVPAQASPRWPNGSTQAGRRGRAGR